MAGLPTDLRRYLCSHLVTLSWKAQSCTANLEEICRTAAILESDEPVPCGVQVEVRTAHAHFHGTIASVDQHDLGWRIRIEFSLMTPWSPESFEPEHLLDPSALE